MISRHSILGLLVCCLVLSANPVLASTMTTNLSATERASLVELIATLQAEVERLQRLLAARTSVVQSLESYQARLFTQPFEATYFVQAGRLQPLSGKSVRPADEQLFMLFVDTIGESAVNNYVKEWRVFATARGGVDAYVEQIVGTDTFVVNLNRLGFDVSNLSDVTALQELFIHEYAHLLFLNEMSLIEEYTKRFWIAEDLQASSLGHEANQFQRHFMANQDRFVSEYALQSVDEDMAETFLVAVSHPETLSFGERQDKYDFLSDRPEIRTEILRLRERLN